MRPGVEVRAVENTASVFHFVLPAKPTGGGELSDADLERIAGGIPPAQIGYLDVFGNDILIGGGDTDNLKPFVPRRRD